MAIRSGRFRLESGEASRTIIKTAGKAKGGAFYRVLNSGTANLTVNYGASHLLKPTHSVDFYIDGDSQVSVSPGSSEGIYEFLGDGSSTSISPDSVRSGRCQGDHDTATVNNKVTVIDLSASSKKPNAFYRFLNSGENTLELLVDGTNYSIKKAQSLDISTGEKKKVEVQGETMTSGKHKSFECIYDFLSGED